MVWSAIGTKLLGTGLAAYGFGLITPIGWGAIGLIWGYSIVWAFLTDWAKVMVYRHFGMETPRHQAFLNRVKQFIAPRVDHEPHDYVGTPPHG
jgi:H+-transporting ATPase